jgi:putative tryptophan/tyrosine transport system substrate-binding protein
MPTGNVEKHMLRGPLTRRYFVGCLAGAAVARPLAARAQQPALPVIGLLGVAPASSYANRVDGLRSGLQDLGYVEGRNVIIEFRWADSPAQLPELAAELVNRGVAVMVTSGNTATRAAKAATSDIPIVFAAADDPVRLGFVASFNRPGGNVTGLSLISGALGPKRLDLLRSLVPHAKIIGVLMNPANPAEDNVRAEQATARSIGQRILVLDASTVAEIEQAFAGFVREQSDALLVNADSLFTAQRELLATLAARYRLPAIYAWREFAEAGGLMSYGTNLNHSYHQVGAYVGRILKGEKPADLPVMQPTTFELVINLKTAKALGLQIPDKLLALTDQVIE